MPLLSRLRSPQACLWGVVQHSRTFPDWLACLLPPRRANRKPSRQGPPSERMAKDTSDYNLSEIASPTSLANWNSTPAELPVEKHAMAAMRDALSTTAQAPTHDFLSKGLMAYEQPDSSSEFFERTHAAHRGRGRVGSGRCWRRSVSSCTRELLLSLSRKKLP